MRLGSAGALRIACGRWPAPGCIGGSPRGIEPQRHRDTEKQRTENEEAGEAGPSAHSPFPVLRSPFFILSSSLLCVSVVQLLRSSVQGGPISRTEKWDRPFPAEVSPMAAWNPRANEIFLKALDIDAPEERERYLDAACREQEELRAEVDSLLWASDRAGTFLQAPAAALSTVVNAAIRPIPGTVLGPYRLLRQIGEGGMGTVFLAEQTHPVQRQVALKVIKTGVDSGQVAARFAAERKALALMDHPNIAKVFDAGTVPFPNSPSDGGRPYFVMELIEGVPITKYCDQHRLDPRARLELFIPVCHALQHAHQKGIIHRDLKPSNVLIALYDGKPVPKVIDFGVAKATEQRLTERTMFTGFGDVIGTLEYMSPEQAEVNQLDVDTRSDIYSLGVLLYELLTGSTPLDRQRLRGVPLLEVLRRIREEEPQRPSARLDSAEERAAIAAHRGLEPSKLSGQLRQEVDWIVLKCLEKDRDRRYESSSALAADLERYLADEAVLACPPSAWYRFRKFARRNKASLLTVTTVLVGLAVSTLLIARAYHEESLQRVLAEKKEREA